MTATITARGIAGLLKEIGRDGVVALCQDETHWIGATTKNGRVMGLPRTWDALPTQGEAIAAIVAKIAGADESDRALYRSQSFCAGGD
jgi:hypothetical protein